MYNNKMAVLWLYTSVINLPTRAPLYHPTRAPLYHPTRAPLYHPTRAPLYHPVVLY